MRAKNFLLQAQRLERIIENRQAEIDKWQAIAESATAQPKTIKVNGEEMAAERVQSSGEKDRMGDAVSTYVDIQTELTWYKEQLIKTYQRIERTLEKMDADEYDVLHKIYLQHKYKSEVADEIGKSYSWVAKTHQNGLKNLQKILDGDEAWNRGQNVTNAGIKED